MSAFLAKMISLREHKSTFVFALEIALSFLIFLPPTVGCLVGRQWLGIAAGLGLAVVPYMIYYVALLNGWVTFP